VTDERPGPDALSDDTRDREPLRDRADNPPEAGIRSDLGGTGTGASGVSQRCADDHVTAVEESWE